MTPWRAFNFAWVPPPQISGLDTELQQSQKLIAKTCVQKVWFQEKKSTSSWIRTNDFFFSNQVFYQPPEHRGCMSAVELNGMLLKFSLHLRLQLVLQSERKHAWTRGNKLGVGRWWALRVRHLISRNQQSQASYRQTDGRTDGFSA